MQDPLDGASGTTEGLPGESSEALIAAAKAQKLAVSKRQLAEWHRAGLLPEPMRSWHGRHGSESIYPAGTRERLLALCACRKRYPHNLQDVAWCLWWQGHDVPMRYARTRLEQVAAEFGQEMEQVRAAPKEGGQQRSARPRLSQAAKAWIGAAQTRRIRDQNLAGARRRTGTWGYPTFVRVLFEVALGLFKGFDAAASPETAAEDRQIVEKALGLTRARTDRLIGAEPWLSGDSGDALQLASQVVTQYPPGFDLATATDEALCQTRDEVRTFLNFLDELAKLTERLFGRHAFGLTVIGWAIRRLRPRDQAFVLLLWRSCRATDLVPNMDGLLGTARYWQRVALPTYRALEALRTEVPATAKVLSPQQMGKALRSKRAMDETVRALMAIREQYAAQMDAFFAHYPELFAVLEAEQRQPSLPSTPVPTSSQPPAAAQHETSNDPS